MNSSVTSGGERQVSEVFETLNPILPDKGFSEMVVRRIRRRVWLRRIILSTAILVGGVLALDPLCELAVWFSRGSLVVATRWNDPIWLMQNQALVLVAVLSLIWPGVVRALEK